MTVRELITKLEELIEHGLAETAICKAFDGDEGEMMPVTGLLYDNNELEFCTDDPD